MYFIRISKVAILAAIAVLGVRTTHAQTVAGAIMPSAVASGMVRSHAWISASVAPAALHAPGQATTNCSPTTNVCYYFPSDILTAYAVKSIANGNGGAGMTVAIVDAYYNSQTEADLATYSTTFSLPACSTASGCLTIVTQTGGSNLAAVSACTNPMGMPTYCEGWAQETDLDVQTVHAIAPNAKILLIVCNSANLTDLGTGVLYAQAHANVVTNSYGADEFSGEATNDFYYSGSSVPILFSSGDAGSVTEYPCTSAYTLCVGGTRLLATSTSFRNIESAWGGSMTSGGGGGGCSNQIAEPVFQAGYSTCGAARGVPDVAALADEYTGFVVSLGTFASGNNPGFYVFGGTSLASPLTAAIVAVIDTARAAISKKPLGSNLNALIYQSVAAPYYRYRVYDVQTGTTGSFAAGPGWDQADGLGVILGPAMASYLVGLP